MNMKKKIFMLFALVMTVMTASAVEGYTLSVGTNEHGTIKFKVGTNENATTANEGGEVTVTITPAEGWTVNPPTGKWYAAIAAARGQRRVASVNIDLLQDVEQTAVTGQENQWTSSQSTVTWLQL